MGLWAYSLGQRKHDAVAPHEHQESEFRDLVGRSCHVMQPVRKAKSMLCLGTEYKLPPKLQRSSSGLKQPVPEGLI